RALDARKEEASPRLLALRAIRTRDRHADPGGEETDERDPKHDPDRDDAEPLAEDPLVSAQRLRAQMHRRAAIDLARDRRCRPTDDRERDEECRQAQTVGDED